jgi:hypothetical protein
MAGLDLSAQTSRSSASGWPRRAVSELTVGDMTDFRLPRPVDAAICMQDSQGHLLTNDALVRHLRAVAANLRPGGLYIFDRYMASSWTNPARSWSWSKRRGRLIVRASFSALNDVNPVTQVFREKMTLEAVENGTRRIYRQTHASRMVFPGATGRWWRWPAGSSSSVVLRLQAPPGAGPGPPSLLMVVVLRRTGR